MCCAPNVYMIIYTLIGAHIVPLMLQNDSHLNCLCVMARLIEALAI